MPGLARFLAGAKKTSISTRVPTKAAHQTKQKRNGHLLLSAQALVLVASVIEVSDPELPFLFLGNKPGQPLREIKKFWAAVLRQASIANYRRHDNRHTYASYLVFQRPQPGDS